MSSIEAPNIAGSQLSSEFVRCILRRLSSKVIGRISHLGAVSRGWARRRAASGWGTAPTRQRRAAYLLVPTSVGLPIVAAFFSGNVVHDCNAVKCFKKS